MADRAPSGASGAPYPALKARLLHKACQSPVARAARLAPIPGDGWEALLVPGRHAARDVDHAGESGAAQPTGGQGRAVACAADHHQRAVARQLPGPLTDLVGDEVDRARNMARLPFVRV